MANVGKRLTKRQKEFADCYLELGNVKRAAEKAGFKPSYAYAVKTRPKVKEYLYECTNGFEVTKIANAKEILAYLTRILRGEEPEGGNSARLKAAEMLAKRLGLLSESQDEKPERAVVIDDVPDYPRSVNA